jgi:hypothetical protein
MIYPAGTILQVVEPGNSRPDHHHRQATGPKYTRRIARVSVDDGAEMIEVQLERSLHTRHHGRWAPMSIRIPRSSVLRIIKDEWLGRQGS